jgi:carboxyl-terminal processing protease
MQKKVLAFSFLMAISLSFISGYLINNVISISFFNERDTFFETVSETLQEHYFYNINDTDLVQIYKNQMINIVDTFADYYNDPYTRLEIYDNAIVSKEAVGIGISIVFQENIPIITSVLYESDAYKKLYPNDRLLGIKGIDFTIMFENLTSPDEVMTNLKRNLGDKVVLIVENPLRVTREVEITYTDLTPSDLSYARLNERTGYIQISRFNPYISESDQGTAARFSEALKTLEENTLRESSTLVIDLRFNPGGSLSALHNKGNPDLPIGIIQQLISYDATRSVFEFVDNKGVITKYYGGLSEEKPYNIIVLVNASSASASEVLAASLESNGYEVFGTQTFGKHFYQNSIRLAQINNESYMLVYTEGTWTYNNGVSIETSPIPLTHLELTNLKQFNMTFDHIIQFDQVDTSIIDVQKLLNRIFSLQLREDGYFDEATKQAILSFQRVEKLSETGQYDYQTFQTLHDVWLEYVHNVFLDIDMKLLLETYENN